MAPRLMFDHEKLEVYRLSVEFARWVSDLLDGGELAGCKWSAVKHLDDSSRSILNNIAEGNGKRSLRDRCRFFDVARGSALECAASLDVLVARRKLDDDQAEVGKAILVRIVSMLVKLIEKLLGPDEFGALAVPSKPA
jgi:four helix bundle protein